eukprot:jgi/Undpi1/10516/HiC_scaffold_29.g12966.m1
MTKTFITSKMVTGMLILMLILMVMIEMTITIILMIIKVLVTCGLMVLVYEIFAVPNVTPRLGVRMSQRAGSVFVLPVYFLLTLLSNANYAGTHVTIIAIILLFTCYVGSNMFYIGVALALNNAVATDRRGELNGISAAGGSLARAISPMICSVLFAFSIDGDHPFPFDYHFAFYLLATLRLVVACMAWNRINDTQGRENSDIECAKATASTQEG